MGVEFPNSNPSVGAATRIREISETCPRSSAAFNEKLEAISTNPENMCGLRVIRSLASLLVSESLRFPGALNVGKIRKTDTAVCGISVNSKDRNGDCMHLATPKTGLTGEIAPIPFWRIGG